MIKWIVIFLLLSAPALAQQRPPNEEALAQKLMEEINSNLSLRAQIIRLQEQLAAQKDPKPEAKPEPKK